MRSAGRGPSGLGDVRGDAAELRVARSLSALLSHWCPFSPPPWLLLILDVFIDCYWLEVIVSVDQVLLRFNQSTLLAWLLVSKMQ